MVGESIFSNLKGFFIYIVLFFGGRAGATESGNLVLWNTKELDEVETLFMLTPKIQTKIHE